MHVHNDLKRVVLCCIRALEERALYKLLIGLQWPHYSDITLIEDATHVSMLSAGEGVNVDMNDAFVLASEIIKACSRGKNPDESARDYEEHMFSRSMEAVIKRAKNREGHFSGPGAKECIYRLKAHCSGQGDRHGLNRRRSDLAEES